MKRCYIIGCLCFVLFSVRATTVTQMTHYGPVTIHRPVLTDTLDIKGKTFDPAMLLEATFNPQTPESGWPVVTAGTNGFFSVPAPQTGFEMHRFGFTFTPDRYAVMKLKITSPDRFEVYVNGNKQGNKTTVNDTLTQPAPSEFSITAEPRAYRVTIQYLVSTGQAAPSGLTVQLIPEKKDSAVSVYCTPEPEHTLYIEDLLVGRRISSVSVSENGKYALLRYTTTFSKGTKSHQQKVMDTGNGHTLRYFNPAKTDLGWMPRSGLLYYTVIGMEGRELRTLHPETGEEHTIARNLPEGHFTWSPDESYLIFSIYQTADPETGPLKRVLVPDDRQPEWRKRINLYKYDLSDGLMQRLTFGYQNTFLNDISADGKQLLFTETSDVLTERPVNRTSLYRLDLNTMQTDTIWYRKGFLSRALFSPDAKQLLIHGTGEAFDGIGLNILPGQISNMYDMQAFIMNLATKQVTPVTRDFDPSVNSMGWSRYDNKIYLTCTDRDYVDVYRYDPVSASFEKLPLKTDVVTSFNRSDKAPVAVYAGQNVSYPGRAYLYHIKNGKSDLLDDPQAAAMKETRLGEVHDWNFTSTDGSVIEGRYYLPPGFDPASKYPVIVYYYSGTTPTDRSFEHRYSMHLYAAQGYIVYTLQPSGAIGYGQEFAARHVNAWGKQTADDIIRGTKEFCRAHAFTDSTRIGCIGASYGGFMTQYLQTRTDIFAAAVSHAGISALSSYWGEGFWGYSYSEAASAYSYPWNNPDLYVNQSPLFRADKINTPILLLHGIADTNVPVGESIQMYTALKLLGKQVEFIQVEGENHGIIDFNKRLAWKKSIFAWFDRWLKNEPGWWNSLYPDKTL